MKRGQEFLGLDFGTSSCKLVLCDDSAQEIRTGVEPYHLLRPQKDWAETDPSLYWKSFCKLLEKIDCSQLRAVGVTGAWGIFIALNKSNEIVRPAIILTGGLDRRIHSIYQDAKTELAKIGLHPKGPFGIDGLALLFWLRKNEPDVYRSMEKTFFSIKDYVIYKLSGEFVTDYQVASNLLFYDMKRKQYPAKLVKLLDLERKLPRVEAFSNIVRRKSRTSEGGPIPYRARVIVGTGDGPSASLGSGAFANHLALSMLSTASTLELLAWRKDVSQRVIRKIGYDVSPKLINLGFQICGSGEAFRWFKEQFVRTANTYQSMNDEAADIQPGSDGLVFVPYLGGRQMPPRSSTATGAFLGITFSHRRSHFIRAIMEGTGYAIRRGLEYVESLGVKIKEIRLAGAGSQNEDMCQVIADITKRNVSVAAPKEPSALGAALISAVCSKSIKTLADASSRVKVSHRLEPRPQVRGVYDSLYRVFRDFESRNK